MVRCPYCGELLHGDEVPDRPADHCGHDLADCVRMPGPFGALVPVPLPVGFSVAAYVTTATLSHIRESAPVPERAEGWFHRPGSRAHYFESGAVRPICGHAARDSWPVVLMPLNGEWACRRCSQILWGRF